jgi:hypothetical protein
MGPIDPLDDEPGVAGNVERSIDTTKDSRLITRVVVDMYPWYNPSGSAVEVPAESAPAPQDGNHTVPKPPEK